MNSSANQFKKVSYYFWSIIVFLAMFGFGYLPTIGGIPHLGMQILGIFIGLLIGWLTVGFIYPSLLAVIALGLTDYTTIAEALSSGFGNNTTIIILLMFIFTAYLNGAGVSEYIAKWLLSRKSLVGHPWRFTFIIWLSAFIISAVTYIYPAILLMWSITYDVCLNLGYKRKDAYPMLVVIGIVTFAGMGYYFMPIKAIALMSYGSLSTLSGGLYSVDFLKYVICSSLYIILSGIAFFIVSKYVLKPDITPLLKINEATFENYRTQKINNNTKIAFIALCTFIVLMVLSCLIPKSVPILGPALRSLTIAGCAIIVIIGLLIIHVSGNPIMDFQNAASSHEVSWSTIIMFVGCMPIADAITSDEAGIMIVLQNYIGPILSNMSPFLFLAVIGAITLLATQLFHNVVLCVMMVPIMYTFAPLTGASPEVGTILIIFTCCTALATPAASAPAAMMFLNTEWIDTKTLYIIEFISLIFSLLSLCILIPLFNFILL